MAGDALAALPVPPFSNSAMDGFLVHRADLSGPGPWPLPLAGDVAAGARACEVPPGRAVRIMTGAPVGDPPADTLQVIPVEQTDLPAGPVPLPETITISAGDHHRSHIRRRGENIQPGEVVIKAGTRLDAGTLAALISTGVTQVSVHPLPRVTVISSGDELVAAGRTPAAGQLPDSNLPMVAALLAQQGLVEISQIHTSDSAMEFQAGLDRAAADSDLVITTGGVSAGAFDVVREVAGGTGTAQMWFGGVAMQPGKPQGLGTWSGTPLLCLPGNPVAAFVSFHLFVSPLIQALSGSPTSPELLARPNITALPGQPMPAPRGRPLIVPVRLDWSHTSPVAFPFTPGGRGSHLVASLAGVDGLALLDPAHPPVAEEPVRVLLIR